MYVWFYVSQKSFLSDLLVCSDQLPDIQSSQFSKDRHLIIWPFDQLRIQNIYKKIQFLFHSMFTFTFFSTSCSLSLSFPLHVLLNQCQLQINGWSPIFWLVASSFVLWSSQLHAPHFISIIFHQHCHQHHNSSAGKHVIFNITSVKGSIKFT